MATPFPSTILPYPIHTPATRNLDPTHPKATSSSSSSCWWTPLFGFSSDPDYVSKPGSGSEPAGSGGSSTRFSPGCFTEEKARELRRKMRETTAFHDVMYHSTIASRLASDVSDP